ncbi:MAG: hypothetical protein OQJ89_05240 [Kangiellaceae bacterium]|nr:hypothetical protein [Kangiellaceae bacterium]MCW9016347.1 hypothetical protein [Kangiellaceae bacterium]
MKKTTGILSLSLLTSLSAFAADNKATICTHGTFERKVEVVYPQGGETPCEVQYTKEGKMNVVWYAEAEIGYCEDKASTFIEKLKGWGWNCELVKPLTMEPEVKEEPKTESNDSNSSDSDSKDF